MDFLINKILKRFAGTFCTLCTFLKCFWLYFHFMLKRSQRVKKCNTTGPQEVNINFIHNTSTIWLLKKCRTCSIIPHLINWIFQHGLKFDLQFSKKFNLTFGQFFFGSQKYWIFSLHMFFIYFRQKYTTYIGPKTCSTKIQFSNFYEHLHDF